jgi:AcrR family transcriptional regulator
MGVGYGIGAVMPAQVAFREEHPPPLGLRSRKKLKTRLAIEDAALALFDEQGYDATTVEHIAAVAEVSTTTFFRYFPSKADVLLAEHGEQLPALHLAIVERPPEETELTAVRRAVVEAWVAAIDPERTAHKYRIIVTSPVLQGLSYERGTRWLEVITDALARRRGRRLPDARSSVAARVALAVLAHGVEGWLATGCTGSLRDAVEQAFELMTDLGGEWSTADRM